MTRKLTVLLMTLLLVALCVPALAAGTLQDQINAAGTTPTTIKLDQDYKENITIAEGQTITLNLNGKTLNGGTGNNIPTITNNGTLTVTGEGTVRRDDTEKSVPSGDHYVVDNQGTMTIESGNFYNDSGLKDDWNGASLIRNAGIGHSASLTINGGTFTQMRFGIVKNDDEGKLTINGGTFTTQGGSIADKSLVYALTNYGEAKITGGEFNGGVSANTWSKKYASEMTITGGTFNDAIAGGQLEGYEGNPVLNIQGGTFNGAQGFDKDTLKLSISNGRFRDQPDLDFVSSGLIVKDSDPKAPYHIGADAEAAIASAKAGSTLTVLRGSAITNVPAGVKVENKTGDKITVNNEPVAPDGEIVIPTPTAAPQPTAKPVPAAPKTGDSTPIALYALCAALAVACAVWMLRRKANA